MCRRSSATICLSLWALLVSAIAVSPTYGQFGGGGQGGGGQGGGGFGGGGQGGQGQGGQGGGGNVNIGQQAAGVLIDANGVLRVQAANDPTGKLTQQRVQAAQAALDPQIAAKSPLRKISLPRLEKALEAELAAGRKPSDDMLKLAGLTRIQYVFYYPETRDIVIAGPAEGWAEDLAGRVRGMASGRPIVQLQDLAVALRAFAPGGKGQVVGCSIDPTQEGLKRLQQFLRSVGSTANHAQTELIVEGLRNNLGLQTVSILGISPKTHMAQVLVEADYRMKLIGIGLEQPPVRMASYVQSVGPGSVSRSALVRWYFTPDYNCVRVSDDSFAMELVGNGVKLIGADELVQNDGTRKANGTGGDKASKAFTTAFTKNYPEIAARSPVYAQLRNMIDLLVACAFIQKQNYPELAGWQMATLGNEQRFPVETQPAPVQVETAVNAIWRGTKLMTPLGGGVTIEADKALISSNMLPDDGGKLQHARQQIALPPLANGPWWWD